MNYSDILQTAQKALDDAQLLDGFLGTYLQRVDALRGRSRDVRMKLVKAQRAGESATDTGALLAEVRDFVNAIFDLDCKEPLGSLVDVPEPAGYADALRLVHESVNGVDAILSKKAELAAAIHKATIRIRPDLQTLVKAIKRFDDDGDLMLNRLRARVERASEMISELFSETGRLSS
jgi:hypothetical protein